MNEWQPFFLFVVERIGKIAIGVKQIVGIPPLHPGHHKCTNGQRAYDLSRSVSGCGHRNGRSRRHCAGLVPTRRPNTLVRWLWSANPQASAMSAIEREEPVRSCLTASIRQS